jgi:hypothetical protein
MKGAFFVLFLQKKLSFNFWSFYFEKSKGDKKTGKATINRYRIFVKLYADR